MFLWKVLIFFVNFLCMHDSEISQRFRKSLERMWGFLSLFFSFSGFSFPFPGVWIALNCLLVLEASKIPFSTGLIHPLKPQIGAYPQAEKAIRKKKGGNVPSVHNIWINYFPVLGSFYSLSCPFKKFGFFRYVLFRVHSFYLY